MSKSILYKDLIARMKKAISEEFFLEAGWIQYAIIEDRINSVIRHAYPVNGKAFLKDFRGLDRKFKHIEEKIHPKDESCRKTIHTELLGRITIWKDKRNDLMHEIERDADFASIQGKVKLLAEEGAKFVNELSSKVRKYKEHKKKA